LHEPPGHLGRRDRLQGTAAQVSDDPAVVTQGFEGQSQPAPGLLEVWELAHAWRLLGTGRADLTAASGFPQETLNLILCGWGLVA